MKLSKFTEAIYINKKEFKIFRLDELEKKAPFCKAFPFSYRVLLENILRTGKSEHYVLDKAMLLNKSLDRTNNVGEIDFFPSRVLMQDFTGVPALADLASMRESAKKKKY